MQRSTCFRNNEGIIVFTNNLSTRLIIIFDKIHNNNKYNIIIGSGLGKILKKKRSRYTYSVHLNIQDTRYLYIVNVENIKDE